MEWAEGWANEDGSFSSVNEMGDSDAPSYNEMDDSDGLNARLNAVADELRLKGSNTASLDLQVDLHVEIVKYRDSKAGSSLVRRIECVVYYSNYRDRNQHRLLNLPTS